MSEKTEATRQAIRKILQETPQDELLKHGIAAHLPAEHQLTPYGVGRHLQIIRKEDQRQASELDNLQDALDKLVEKGFVERIPMKPEEQPDGR